MAGERRGLTPRAWVLVACLPPQPVRCASDPSCPARQAQAAGGVVRALQRRPRRPQMRLLLALLVLVPRCATPQGHPPAPVPSGAVPIFDRAHPAALPAPRSNAELVATAYPPVPVPQATLDLATRGLRWPNRPEDIGKVPYVIDIGAGVFAYKGMGGGKGHVVIRSVFNT